MGNTKITVQQMVDEMPYLSVVSGEQFLDREIYVMDVSRPALELTGYFDYYPQNRIQLFGATEISFINRMTVEEKTIIIKKLCQPEVPAFLVSRGLDIPEEMIQYATEKEIPVILSNRNTTRLNANVMNFLEEHLAERDSQHGVLVEIYGMGVMITGESGIGKSETALELI